MICFLHICLRDKKLHGGNKQPYAFPIRYYRSYSLIYSSLLHWESRSNCWTPTNGVIEMILVRIFLGSFSLNLMLVSSEKLCSFYSGGPSGSS